MLIIFVEINFSKTILRKWALTLPLHLFSCLILSIFYLSRATIFVDSNKRTLWEGVGVGVSYFTGEFFVHDGGPLIKCNGEKRNSISIFRLPHFYSP